MDISQGMVDLYNEHARNQGLSPDELRAVRVDVLSTAHDEPQNPLSGQKFDVVVVSVPT